MKNIFLLSLLFLAFYNNLIFSLEATPHITCLPLESTKELILVQMVNTHTQLLRKIAKEDIVRKDRKKLLVLEQFYYQLSETVKEESLLNARDLRKWIYYAAKMVTSYHDYQLSFAIYSALLLVPHHKKKKLMGKLANTYRDLGTLFSPKDNYATLKRYFDKNPSPYKKFVHDLMLQDKELAMTKFNSQANIFSIESI